MIVRFKNGYHNSDFKLRINNPKKQEFYKNMAKYNPDKIIIYE